MAVEYVRATEADDDVVREFNQVAALVNEIKANLNAVLAKLDLDSGVNGTNFESLHAVTADDADTFYLGY